MCMLVLTFLFVFVFQYFKRDADELESWIHEKLQAASDESYKDPTNLQAKIQKHQAFEAEVAAHSNAIVVLDNTGSEMISQQHFASDVIRQKLGKCLVLRCSRIMMCIFLYHINFFDFVIVFGDS